MTVQGIIVLDLIGLMLLFWILNRVRINHLYVGYGVIFVLAILSIILILSVPRFLTFVTYLVGAIFPTSALTLLALFFIVLMIIYIMTQITLVSNRLAVLVQELAIQQAEQSAERGSRQGGGRLAKAEEKIYPFRLEVEKGN